MQQSEIEHRQKVYDIMISDARQFIEEGKKDAFKLDEYGDICEELRTYIQYLQGLKINSDEDNKHLVLHFKFIAHQWKLGLDVVECHEDEWKEREEYVPYTGYKWSDDEESEEESECDGEYETENEQLKEENKQLKEENKQLKLQLEKQTLSNLLDKKVALGTKQDINEILNTVGYTE